MGWAGQMASRSPPLRSRLHVLFRNLRPMSGGATEIKGGRRKKSRQTESQALSPGFTCSRQLRATEIGDLNRKRETTRLPCTSQDLTPVVASGM